MIEQRLRASLGFGVLDGNAEERGILGTQIEEAIRELGSLRSQVSTLTRERDEARAAEARARELERAIVERHPVWYAYVERARRHDQELQVCTKEHESLLSRVARLTKERNALQAEVESLRLQAEMACIDPRPDCGCSGCQYANEVNGHE